MGDSVDSVKGRTVSIMKDSKKSGVPSNYKPITCLPIMWKLWTGIIGDEIYSHLERSSLLQNELKGYLRRSRWTKDQLTDKTILRNYQGLFNPLSAKSTKWSNTLKQFVGKLPTNCLSVFDHFVGLALKGLRLKLSLNSECCPQ